ncbi:MAG TPA: hypothetical protein VD886_15825 [Herpetosiphonaceae bacterium]|nr:hypothetical protein [Herpetosiphonaceae bacterium]
MQDMSCLWPLAIIVIIGIAVMSMVWQSGRSEDLIDGWARANNLTIVSKEARSFLRGPMFWSTAKGQTVYRITVSDQQGRRRDGWIRCGGRWMGLHSDHVEVRWDGE